MVASGVWAKQIPLQECLQLKSLDKVPVSFGDELQRIGYDGNVKASYVENPLAAHFEIHIEQGPILENEQKKIGIVTGVQAFDWNLVTVKGRSSHSGTTPMNTRSDAILTAAKIITMAVETANKYQGLATVGTLQLEPGSVNVIPNIVKFSLDVRHVKDEILAEMMAEIKQSAATIAKENINSPQAKPLSVDFENITSSKAIKFNQTNIGTVKDAALQLFKSDEIREITSGAGHDSCFTSTRVPTSMIFIPSKDGISHSPEEYSSPEEVENGFKVFAKMNFIYSLFTLLFAVLVVASPVENDALQTQQGEFDLAKFFAELEASLEDPSVFKRDYAPLTAAFTALNQSGQGVQIAHAVYTNNLTQPALINTVENYINATTLTSILNYADNSGLAVDLVMVLFTNPKMFPGLISIIKTLHGNGVISLKKRGLIDGLIGGVIDGVNGILSSVQDQAIQTIVKLMNNVSNPEELYESLEKSGLFISVFEDIVTTPGGQSFAVNLVTEIIDDYIITWSSLIKAVNDSGIIGSVASKIATNSTNRSIILSWIFTNGINLIIQLIQAFF
ncbi:putative hydrolase [Spathaspora sp. JA1]|nr:putative hydrolase [Spathaspora sp. JA1]